MPEQWLAAAGHTDLETSRGYIDTGALMRASFGQPHPPIPADFVAQAADPDLWRNTGLVDANLKPSTRERLAIQRPQRELLDGVRSPAALGWTEYTIDR
jgi:hypothetical protein